MRTKFNGILTLFLALIVQISFAQDKVISGTVSDEAGPLPGVTILKKGTTQGTETDFDGNYSIQAKTGDILVFSFVGMKTVEKTVANASTMNIVMENDNILDEIVVTATGQRKQKRTVGNATATLKASELAEVKLPNPMNALQGKVSGVDISGGLKPGTTQNVIIRGASSFGSNQPLYVVDGVPLTNSRNSSGDNLNSQVDFGSTINAINPDDIAEMNILKGAAATALYGSRAANGVIMITTKSGKDSQGKMQITYDGTYGITKVGFLPVEQKLFGQGWSGDRALNENGNWGAMYDGKDRVWGNVVNNSQLIKPYNYIKDRIRNVFDNGYSFKNYLSLAGGNEVTKYYFSLSQNKVDGVIPTDADSYKRYTVSARGSHNAKKLSISSSINISSEDNSQVATGQGSSFFRSIQEIAGDIPITELANYNSPYHNLDNYFTLYGVNPYFVLNNNAYEQTKDLIYGNFNIGYQIQDNLKVSYTFGGDLETSKAETHEAVRAFTPGSPNSASSNANSGSYSISYRRASQVNHELKTFLDLDISEDIKMNNIVGFNLNERRYSSLTGSISSIDVPGYYNLQNSLTPSTSTQYLEERRLIGAYLNTDISFKDYLYLTLTARNDWSSTLPQKNNSFFYSGQTLAFIVTDFLKSQDVNTGFIDYAKLRLAYGSTGKDAPVYRIYDRFVGGTSTNPGYPNIDDLTFPIGGVNAYSVSNVLGNPNLKPELTSEFEIGTEVQLLNRRVGIDFTYYNKLTEGLIASTGKDPSSGATSQTVNLGDVRNSGIELGVDLTPIKTDNFQWKINWNYTANKNKVEKLTGSSDEINLAGFGGMGIYAVEGKPLGQFKSNTVKKVTIDGKEHTVVDGKGIPLPSVDEEFLGKDINEKYRMGLTNVFTYKNFTLSGTLAYRNGGSFFSYTKDYMHWTGSAVESVYNNRNPFIVPNSVVENADGTYSENTVAVDPTVQHTFYSQGGFEGDGYAVLDRSFLKLRNVSLQYSLPSDFSKKIGFNSVNLSASVANILLWTPKENQYVDPEATTFGNDISAKFGEFGATPSNEYYTFGLNLKF